MGSQVIVISQDSPEGLAKTSKKHKLSDFKFMSDKDMKASLAFGLAFSVDPKTVGIYKNYGIDLVGLYGRSEPLMTTPAVFLVNGEGKIVFEYVNPNYQIRLDPEILKAAVKSLTGKS